MSQQLNEQQKNALYNLLIRLIDQEKARVIIEPTARESGYWFGGGNMVRDAADDLWVSGRFRSRGDSRTGLEAGARGFELALFRSQDNGETFHKVRSWSKQDLSTMERVISIEGTALMQRYDGTWELFVSMEKDVPYPPPYERYQKSGTGIWQIDHMVGDNLESLGVSTLEPVLVNHELPGYLHVKDPYIIANQPDKTILGFCTHPISWASTNSAYATRTNSAFEVGSWEMVGRGPIWDVAFTRITGVLSVPQIGRFAELPPLSVFFYDGAECLRQLDEHTEAYTRPRGYSCEEIGGALVSWDAEFPKMERLSEVEPLFISPWGTRSSRYVSIFTDEQGIRAIWQQSQKDESQPLVTHFLPMNEVQQLLDG